jgi:proteasome lid subunit RPN8/RPN11
VISVGEAWDAAIRTEGENAYPQECCGILLGVITGSRESSGGELIKRVEETIPVVNAWEPEEQYHRFKIDPEDLMKAEFAARKRGQEVLGFYHSHPDHPAQPSDYDRDSALPFYSYIILGVERGKAAELTSWELTEKRQFREELVIRREYGGNDFNSHGSAEFYGP